MASITPDDYQAAYETAKLVYAGNLSLEQGRDQLFQSRGMNRNSSKDYILSYAHYMDGSLFERTISIPATRYYLEQILQEGGVDTLRTALQALVKHVDYYEQISRGNCRGKRRLLAEFNQRLKSTSATKASTVGGSGPSDYPDEVEAGRTYLEGSVRQVTVNAYERNLAARKECIAHHGCRCSICGFDFEAAFGEIGRDFIHVHHLREISSIGGAYVIRPLTDLIPVCPNCHAMLHRRSPAFTPAEIKKRMLE